MQQDIDPLDVVIGPESPAELLRLLDRARQEGPLLPPLTVIPAPVFPYRLGHPLSCLAQFPCPVGCGWAWEERPDLETIGPLVIDQAAGVDGVAAAIDADVCRRREAMHARVEGALLDHYRHAHPDLAV